MPFVFLYFLLVSLMWIGAGRPLCAALGLVGLWTIPAFVLTALVVFAMSIMYRALSDER
jgi:hypothetical protein